MALAMAMMMAMGDWPTSVSARAAVGGLVVVVVVVVQLR